MGFMPIYTIVSFLEKQLKSINILHYIITIGKAKVEEVLEIKKLLYKTWISTYSTLYFLEAINKITSEWHSVKLLTSRS